MLLQTFHEFSRHTMSPLATVLLHTVIALYLIAAVLAVVGLLAPQKVRMLWAELTGGAGTALLAAYFVTRFAESGTEPLRNLFEIVALSALFLGICYLVVTRLRRMPALAAFAYPALTVVFLVNFVFAASAVSGEAREEASLVLVVHVVLTVLSYALFFMATISAVMFLMQERALKTHRDPAYIRTFPPLETLRRQMRTSLRIGLPMLTVSFALGFLVLKPDWSSSAHFFKIVTSVVLWGVMLAAVAGQWAGWLRGRRELTVVLFGFVLVLLTYVALGFWTASIVGAEVAMVEG